MYIYYIVRNATVDVESLAAPSFAELTEKYLANIILLNLVSFHLLFIFNFFVIKTSLLENKAGFYST